MRRGFTGMFAAAVLAGVLGGCAPKANPYPDAARESFHETCPAGNPMCVCTWEKITSAMTYEEYEAALERFAREGLMEPRLTQARTTCIERHGAGAAG